MPVLPCVLARAQHPDTWALVQHLHGNALVSRSIGLARWCYLAPLAVMTPRVLIIVSVLSFGSALTRVSWLYPSHSVEMTSQQHLVFHSSLRCNCDGPLTGPQLWNPLLGPWQSHSRCSASGSPEASDAHVDRKASSARWRIRPSNWAVSEHSQHPTEFRWVWGCFEIMEGIQMTGQVCRPSVPLLMWMRSPMRQLPGNTPWKLKMRVVAFIMGSVFLKVAQKHGAHLTLPSTFLRSMQQCKRAMVVSWRLDHCLLMSAIKN